MRGEKSNYSVSRVRSIRSESTAQGLVPPEAGSWASTLLDLSVMVRGTMGQGNPSSRCSGTYFGGKVAPEAQRTVLPESPQRTLKNKCSVRS